MQRFVLLLVTLLAVMHSFAGAQNEALDWQVYYSEKYNIFYHRSDSLNAINTINIIDAEYASISAELGADVTAPIGIFIAPSLYRFRVLTGGMLPHWGEAVADPSRQIIILKSPRWSKSTSDYRTVVIHELVHVLVGAATDGAPVPRWLGEGLSIYFSGEISYFGGSELSHAQLSDQIIPLAQIDEVLDFEKQKAHLAYQESYLAVIYLFEAYGQSALPSLLSALRQTRDINHALRQAFGINMLQFETDWRQFLLERYRWSFLLEFDKYLWLLILVLFFLALFAVMLRRRRTLARWEKEDVHPSPPSEI